MRNLPLFDYLLPSNVVICSVHAGQCNDPIFATKGNSFATQLLISFVLDRGIIDDGRETFYIKPEIGKEVS